MDARHNKSNYFQSKFKIFSPLLVAFIGWFLLGWGWWRLKTSNCWRAWWIGMATILCGMALGSIGFGFFLMGLS